MTKPCTCSRQIYQSNQPFQNTKESFIVSLTIPNYYYIDFPNFNGLDAELDLWFKFINKFCLCDTEKGGLTSFPKCTFGLKTVRYFVYHNL